jgi:hypothetical protein
MHVFRGVSVHSRAPWPAQTALAFTARVGNKQIEGIDLGTVGPDGKVTHLTVYVRPMSAAMALAQAMQAEMARQMSATKASP